MSVDLSKHSLASITDTKISHCLSTDYRRTASTSAIVSLSLSTKSYDANLSREPLTLLLLAIQVLQKLLALSNGRTTGQ